MDDKVPDQLVADILRGRCVAFVGAGFGMPAIPGWVDLLCAVALRLKKTFPTSDQLKSCSPLELEGYGQILKDAAANKGKTFWENTIKTVLEESKQKASKEDRARLDERRRLLGMIPFKAILTTNFDDSLTATVEDRSANWNLLRTEGEPWWDAPTRSGNGEKGAAQRSTVVKLHGDANGKIKPLPLIFARADYRQQLYEDHNYANFIRAIFSQYTILFLGVSLTDAYLNELRSEVLSLLDVPSKDMQMRPPWGYAVRASKSHVDEFLEKHEGIQILADTPDFTGFDAWLERIAEATSLEGRLRKSLAGKRIIWVDQAEADNAYGEKLFGQAAGHPVKMLREPEELAPKKDAGADLILTRFGYSGSELAVAERLLDRISKWGERPPVIVFAEAETREKLLKENRRRCLRRGAFEFATQWGELFRAIELLFSRTPGAIR